MWYHSNCIRESESKSRKKSHYGPGRQVAHNPSQGQTEKTDNKMNHRRERLITGPEKQVPAHKNPIASVIDIAVPQSKKSP
jgi:hypothetical protein